MEILILGAAGQIARMVTDLILKETDHSLVLFARSAHQRLNDYQTDCVTLYDGDFNNRQALKEAMTDIDIVYLNDLNSASATESIVAALKENQVKQIIVATILGIYDEVPGAFGQWNLRMVGASGIERHRLNAELIEQAGVDHTLLRLTWLYNQVGNEDYILTQRDEPFYGAQVSRQAVARLVMDILEDPNTFKNQSLGVGEPNTDWDRPSFY